MPTTQHPGAILFDDPIHDLIITVGTPTVRTFRVHKQVVYPAIRQIKEQGRESFVGDLTHIHIPENPDVVETMLRHVYGFQSPRLQLNNIINMDFDKKSLWREFSFIMDLRKVSRRYAMKGVNGQITALLLGACLQHRRVLDDELIKSMCREVNRDLDNSTSMLDLHLLAAREAHIRSHSSGPLTNGPQVTIHGSSPDGTDVVTFPDPWASYRAEFARRLRARGFDWVFAGLGQADLDLYCNPDPRQPARIEGFFNGL